MGRHIRKFSCCQKKIHDFSKLDNDNNNKPTELQKKYTPYCSEYLDEVVNQGLLWHVIYRELSYQDVAMG